MTVIYLPNVMTAVERSKPSNYPPSSSYSEASVIKIFGGILGDKGRALCNV